MTRCYNCPNQPDVKETPISQLSTADGTVWYTPTLFADLATLVAKVSLSYVYTNINRYKK